MNAPGAPAPGTISCPRCAAPVGPDQSWCVACGAAARTRLAPVPNWRAPVAILGGVVALCLVALVLAFVTLTDDPVPALGTTGTTGTSGTTGATAVPPAPVPVAPTGPSGATGTTGAPEDEGESVGGVTGTGDGG